MISTESAQAKIKTAQSFLAIFAGIIAILPSLIDSLLSLAPSGHEQFITRIKSVVTAALAFEGHAVEVIEEVWPQVEPLIEFALQASGNPAAAAIVHLFAPKPATS
jgi:hypothetical protein